MKETISMSTNTLMKKELASVMSANRTGGISGAFRYRYPLFTGSWAHS
jgi:hypothetical protein